MRQLVIPGRPDARTADRYDVFLPTRTSGGAGTTFTALLRVGPRVQGHDRNAAGARARTAESGAQRPRPPTVAQLMRLNYTLAELTNNFTEYREGLYWLTVMGAPSSDGAVGVAARRPPPHRQLFRDGRSGRDDARLLGFGARRRRAGQIQRYAVLQDVQNAGLALVQSLRPDQRRKAIVTAGKKTGNNAQGQAYRDNLHQPQPGVEGPNRHAQRDALVGLIADVCRQHGRRPCRGQDAGGAGAARETYFGWIGEHRADSGLLLSHP